MKYIILTVSESSAVISELETKKTTRGYTVTTNKGRILRFKESDIGRIFGHPYMIDTVTDICRRGIFRDDDTSQAKAELVEAANRSIQIMKRGVIALESSLKTLSTT